MTRDPLAHWPGCSRALVHGRRHPDGTRTVCCFTCGALVKFSPNGRVLARHTPDTAPMWAPARRIQGGETP